MATTHSKTQAATSATTQTEGKADAEMKKHLSEAFEELDELHGKLPDLRKPAKKCESDIKSVYDVLEKRGYDRKAAKFLYDQHRMKKKFTPEFKLTVNAYLKAVEPAQGNLFDVSELTRQ